MTVQQRKDLIADASSGPVGGPLRKHGHLERLGRPAIPTRGRFTTISLWLFFRALDD